MLLSLFPNGHHLELRRPQGHVVMSRLSSTGLGFSQPVMSWHAAAPYLCMCRVPCVARIINFWIFCTAGKIQISLVIKELWIYKVFLPLFFCHLTTFGCQEAIYVLSSLLSPCYRRERRPKTDSCLLRRFGRRFASGALPASECEGLGRSAADRCTSTKYCK